MKTISSIFLPIVALVFFYSCSSLKQISFYEDTDSYVNARQERKKKMEALALQKKQAEERQKHIQDSIAKEQEKMNNNPYYKEPNYNKDDYYDYEYAARIKRFYNPVSGLGYYDNWYTNYGFYGAPNYGSSIYMGYGNYSPYMGYGYSWGNPYYSYGFGLGTCWNSPVLFAFLWKLLGLFSLLLPILRIRIYALIHITLITDTIRIIIILKTSTVLLMRPGGLIRASTPAEP
ncbi:MAG: hypothetical protein KatS3mg028_0493 [Bacteroidia bacterium]|nr:MAG: hypothetical protein KatS3mg028_0493 [Bacteroidia bacterium]